MDSIIGLFKVGGDLMPGNEWINTVYPAQIEKPLLLNNSINSLEDKIP